MRAVFEIGREPMRPDPLRQVPVDEATAVDAKTLEAARQGIAAHIARTNLQDAIRALWVADARAHRAKARTEVR